jgi:drug/metabolite transporter (DMT)-like permease
MNWLVFVVIGHFFWASNAVISKVLITKYVNNIFVYAIFIGLVSFLPVLAVPFKPIALPDFSLLLIALITGMFYVYALIPYLKALSIEEVSRVMPIWRFTPLFVLILSILFLDEQLTDYELMAFFVLFLGGLLISIHKTKDTFKVSKAFYLMLLTCLLFAIYSILAKFVYHHLPFYDGFILIRIGSVFAALVLLSVSAYRSQFVKTFVQLPIQIKRVAFLYGIFNVLGHVFLNLALFMAPVSLVSASSGINSVLVLLIALLLSHKYPHILKEDFTKMVLLQKSVAIFLIIIGAGIIVLF